MKRHLIFSTIAACVMLSSCSSAASKGATFRIIGRIDNDLLIRFISGIDKFDRISITSEGEDIVAASKIARLVKERNIDVDVVRYCLSACSQMILPAARSIYIERDAIVAMHNSPLTLGYLLKVSGFERYSQKYEKLVSIENSFYSDLGVDANFLINGIWKLEPICIVENTGDQDFAGVAFKYAFYVPSRSLYEKWIGKSVDGFWPSSKKAFFVSARKSIPKRVNLSFVFGEENESIHITKKIELCEKEDLQ